MTTKNAANAVKTETTEIRLIGGMKNEKVDCLRG